MALREVTEDARRVVYDRTSGDEDSTGQDPRGQLALTVDLAVEAGRQVLSRHGDADVPGDTPWEERPGLLDAMVVSKQSGAPIFVREVSRLWRGEPARGLFLLERLPALEVYGAPEFERRDGAWVRDDSGSHLVRFVGLWRAWDEKRFVRVRTQQKMDAFKDGAPTRSGKPPGRPEVAIAPAHLEEARRVYGAGGRGALAAAWRRVLELREYDPTADPRTRKARYVGKETVARALGLRPEPEASTQNESPPKTLDAPSRGPSIGKGPVVGERAGTPNAHNAEVSP